MGKEARGGPGGPGALRRRLAVGIALLTASGVLALAAPGEAGAAPSRCQGRKVRTLTFSTGYVNVYKKNGTVCAITFQRNPGRNQRMSVSVQARGFVPVPAAGTRTRSIGPVQTHAGHRCVRVKGAVGRGSVSTGWILC
ncbi:hypothetical protein [Streptomyces sp. NBC_00582]|uniref:hypothetical protein n=1 Tax=Streptomyces sp. NBC_00582 TaxID=2975783 RepID=UPI0010CE4928|nr:hypothetical protein [Streptomyces sp. NBC_00582]WUB64516.1 hypothetical protein OG852_31025 [Streptomyces sp. NBC_00582]